MKTPLQRIEAAIAWYNALPRDFNDIDGLMTASNRFACAIFDFSVEVGALYRAKNAAEFERKRAYMLARAVALDGQEKPSYSAADALADQATVKERQNEFTADSEYVASKLLLDSARDVLDRMNQMLSNLKQEKRLTPQTQN